VKKHYDFLVIGGGIVGLSIGRELLKRNPRSSVLVAEKESAIAAHASGRNSGVLHAGFYYSPDSLKAKFCLEGNLELRSLIEAHNLPINKCGKVVVAKNEEDLTRMQSLYQRGLINGVTLHKLSASKLNEYEPLAKTHKEFLWSPQTAVSDPLAVAQTLLDLFLKSGGDFTLGSNVEVLVDKQIRINGSTVSADQIINAAGTNAIHIAHKVGAGKEYSQLPVLGLYKYSEGTDLPLRTLVYPVPNPKNPFLGVHFTLTVDGKVKIGPTAIPILGREQYGLKRNPDSLDFKSSLKSLSSLLVGSPLGLANLAATELPKIYTKRLVREGRELVPHLKDGIEWKKKRPGIRAQLVNLETNSFEMDFVVEKKDNYVHVLNAVSPGWTSAIPFAKYIVQKYC
jgi:(S)-2-hydroxyglutarate dehydrogenase